MAIDIKFLFLAATVITIFATGSVLMGLISAGTKSADQEVSDAAGGYSSVFWGTTLFLAILSAAVVILMGSRRAPY